MAVPQTPPHGTPPSPGSFRHCSAHPQPHRPPDQPNKPSPGLQSISPPALHTQWGWHPTDSPAQHRRTPNPAPTGHHMNTSHRGPSLCPIGALQPPRPGPTRPSRRAPHSPTTAPTALPQKPQDPPTTTPTPSTPHTARPRAPQSGPAPHPASPTPQPAQPHRAPQPPSLRSPARRPGPTHAHPLPNPAGPLGPPPPGLPALTRLP